MMDSDKRKAVVDIWKAIVEVQRHFNDISMRIRGMFVTLLLAFFAAMGFLIDRKLSLHFWIFDIQFAILVAGFGIFATWLFYFIDRYWYHRLLVGSVVHAIWIEKKHLEDLPELSLSAAIGKESPYKPRGIMRLLSLAIVRHEKFRKEGMLHSDGKIELFYKSVILVLTLIAVLLVFSGGITLSKQAPTHALKPSQPSVAQDPWPSWLQ